MLGKTLGVPLFQEQAMQVAIHCAGFAPGEADQLRRSMATFKFTGGVSHFKDKLIEGMVDKGYERSFVSTMTPATTWRLMVRAQKMSMRLFARRSPAQVVSLSLGL